MAIKFLTKLRKELYNVSEVEDFEYVIKDLKNDNKAILKFLTTSKDLRNKSESEIIECFISAFECNGLLAIKSLFYIRDKVCGLGERRVFKVIINYLALNESEILIKNLQLIYKYGRWDDYYVLFCTPLEEEVIRLFKNQLSIDLNSKTPSMLGKWLKSENTSSKNSRKLAVRTRRLLGYTSQEYRLILSSLRKKIDIIEKKISAGNFNSIDYSKFSLDTCLRYKNSFIRNDRERYMKHIKIYNKNDKFKLNNDRIMTLTQTPFNIIELIMNNKGNITHETKSIYEKIWNIVCDNYKEILQDTYVIIAISDKAIKACAEAYKVCISTVLFFNNFNSSSFKDYYMYFKKHPYFAKVQSCGIVEQVNNMKNFKLSTPNNIESALDLLLFTSIKKDLSNNKIPKNILIISDLDLEHKYKESNDIQLIKNKWKTSGYIMPKLKFWQIEEGSLNKSISKDIYSNIFARGYSKEIFTSLLKEEVINSDELILKSLENNRYNDINY